MTIGVSNMRGFLFGAFLGAFCTVYCLGAMPEPVNSYIDMGICKGAEVAGQELGMCMPEDE